MASFESKKGFITAESAADQVKAWDVPEVEKINPRVYTVMAEQPQRFELTQEDIDRVKDSARYQGYQEGYTAGFASGKERIESEIQHLVSVVNQMVKPLASLDSEIEQSIVQLIREMTEQILLTELEIKPEHITVLLQECLNNLPIADNDITVHCHPADYTYIDSYLKSHEVHLLWHLEKDESLMRGGCRVQARHTKISADINQRIHEVIARMLPIENPNDGTEITV